VMFWISDAIGAVSRPAGTSGKHFRVGGPLEMRGCRIVHTLDA